MTALNIIENFGKHSGLKLNQVKTEGIYLGKLKNCTEQIGNINWAKKPIKALGIYFGLNQLECNLLNWEKKKVDCESLINKWLKRNLPFFGKIKVIKTLVMPKFVYLVQSTKVPFEKIKIIDSLIYNFLWHGKREKIKRTTLIGQINQGGLDMLDTASFFKSLKIKWIKKLLEKDDANWKILPNYFLKEFGNNFLVFNMNLGHIKNIKHFNSISMPGFYTDIIETWLEIKQGEKAKIETFEQIRKQIIWGNKEIMFSNKCLFFKEWMRS